MSKLRTLAWINPKQVTMVIKDPLDPDRVTIYLTDGGSVIVLNDAYVKNMVGDEKYFIPVELYP